VLAGAPWLAGAVLACVPGLAPAGQDSSPSHVPLKSVLAGGPWLAGAVLACVPGLAPAVLVGVAGLAVRGLAVAGAEPEAGVEARVLLGDDVRAGPDGALLGDDVRAGPDGALLGDDVRAGPDGTLDGALPVAGGAGAAGAPVGCAVGWGPGGSRRVDAAPAEDSGVVLVFEALPEHPPANKVKATATKTTSLRIGPTLPSRSGKSGRSSGWFDRDLWTAALTTRRPTLAPESRSPDGIPVRGLGFWPPTTTQLSALSRWPSVGPI
jgi:hypothetical protein